MVPGAEPERPDPRDRRSLEFRLRGLRVRRDPALPGREDRTPAAGRAEGALGRAAVADVPDGRRRADAGPGERLLPLRAREDPVRDRALPERDAASVHGARRAPARARVPGGRVLDRRHRHLALGLDPRLVGRRDRRPAEARALGGADRARARPCSKGGRSPRRSIRGARRGARRRPARSCSSRPDAALRAICARAARG